LLRISATIITHDEARNIARVIGSLSVADEIVVVDADSTDDTRQIASGLGARLISHPFVGFAAQKNFASEQAQNDWILSLDADEELNPEAREAISLWKAQTSGTILPRVAGYRFARRARYLGRWILHSGWYPDWKLRLYDRRRGRWAGAYVHESVAVNAPVGTLPGEILHYTCDSLEEHRQRIEFYTDLAAREMMDKGEEVTLLRRVFAPPWIFLNTYFLRLGILDGHQGVLIAWMAARYVGRKYSKWAAMKIKVRESDRTNGENRPTIWTAG
jgi:glycosyltransferase involved in cell wall biosynthesis